MNAEPEDENINIGTVYDTNERDIENAMDSSIPVPRRSLGQQPNVNEFTNKMSEYLRRGASDPFLSLQQSIYHNEFQPPTPIGMLPNMNRPTSYESLYEKEYPHQYGPSPNYTGMEYKKQPYTPYIYDSYNWSGANLETLSQWVQTSSFHIESLELIIIHYRSIVRKNVLLGLIFSTASGSISLSQMNSREQQLVYNIIFVIMSFSIAVFTGLIKIYQIQEQLEEFIKLKQEWIGLSVTITTEVQLPVSQRKPALELITKHKKTYLDLLKRDIDIPHFIKNLAYKYLYDDKQLYLDNYKKFKKLKDILRCTDETFFLSEVNRYEKEDVNVLKNTKKYKTKFFNKQNKDIDKKTSLSNILLYVIMDEENEQRTDKINMMLNEIRKRKTDIEKKMGAVIHF